MESKINEIEVIVVDPFVKEKKLECGVVDPFLKEKKPEYGVIDPPCIEMKKSEYGVIDSPRIDMKKPEYKCSICLKKFNQKYSLKQHYLIHTGERPFECDLCSKTFTQQGALQRHLIIHLDHRPFKCIFCHFSFRQNIHLTRHMKLHTGTAKIFKCIVCERDFSRKEALQRHYSAKHVRRTKYYTCRCCNKTYVNKDTFQKHENKCYKSDAIQYKDGVYRTEEESQDEIVKTNKELNEIVRTNEELNDIVNTNEELNEVVKTNKDSNEILKTNEIVRTNKESNEISRTSEESRYDEILKTNEKPNDETFKTNQESRHNEVFVCTICNTKYKRIINTTLNESNDPELYNICLKCVPNESNSILKEIKLHTCTDCNIEFDNATDLTQHTKVKVCFCSKCNTIYSNQCSYNQHIELSHPRGVHLCELCNAKFNCLNELQKHYYNHRHDCETRYKYLNSNFDENNMNKEEVCSIDSNDLLKHIIRGTSNIEIRSEPGSSVQCRTEEIHYDDTSESLELNMDDNTEDTPDKTLSKVLSKKFSPSETDTDDGDYILEIIDDIDPDQTVSKTNSNKTVDTFDSNETNVAEMDNILDEVNNTSETSAKNVKCKSKDIFSEKIEIECKELGSHIEKLLDKALFETYDSDTETIESDIEKYTELIIRDKNVKTSELDVFYSTKSNSIENQIVPNEIQLNTEVEETEEDTIETVTERDDVIASYILQMESNEASDIHNENIVKTCYGKDSDVKIKEISVEDRIKIEKDKCDVELEKTNNKNIEVLHDEYKSTSTKEVESYFDDIVNLLNEQNSCKNYNFENDDEVHSDELEGEHEEVYDNANVTVVNEMRDLESETDTDIDDPGIHTSENSKLPNTNEKIFFCYVCKKGFCIKKSLVRHFNINHLKKDQSCFCEICHKKFQSKNSLKLHYLLHLPHSYKCNQCNKTFNRKDALASHELIHSNKKSFPCNKCNKSFNQKQSLYNHNITHHNENKKYQCDFCSKKFYLKGTLSRHYLSHTNERNFKCTICKMSFIQKNHLQKHMLRHDEIEKKVIFTCEHCSKVFYRKDILLKHQLVHETNRILFNCKFCNKMYKNNITKEKHELSGVCRK